MRKELKRGSLVVTPKGPGILKGWAGEIAVVEMDFSYLVSFNLKDITLV